MCVWIIYVYTLHSGGVGRLCEGWMKGESPSGGEVSTCELYDPMTDRWRDGPPLPQALAAPGVIKYMGTIYVMGRFLWRRYRIVV